jgi:hypothetical protein
MNGKGLLPRKRDEFRIFDEVAQAICAQCFQKILLCLEQRMLETAHAVDLAGVGFCVETFYERRCFKQFENFADIDLFRRFRQPNAAVAALSCGDIAQLREGMHNFAQMFLGNAEGLGDGGDRHDLSSRTGKEQYAQGVIGVAGQAHESLPSGRWGV